MGKQYDKIIKRRRRSNYLERKKVKAKEAAVAATKPRVRKPAAPRKTPAAPKPVEATTPVAAAPEPAVSETTSAPAE